MGIDRDERLIAEAAELRRRAEKRFGETRWATNLTGTEEDSRLLHELQVHQIELEMQNEELRQSRDEVEVLLAKYTDLYDFAPVGYLTLDRGETILAANLTVAILLGIERSRLIGRRFEQFIAAADRPVFTATFRKVSESSAKDVCEVALLREGKGPLFVQIEAMAAAAGQECRIALINITERKWIEDKLRMSEHQLAEAQKLAHLGSWQWDAIADRITGSDEFYRIFGLIFTSYEDFLALVHPDDRHSVDKAVHETLDRQSPYNVYYRVVPPHDAVRIIHAQGQAIANSAGTVVRMMGIVQDVTERRHLEEKLEILNTNLAARATELEAANIDLEAFNYTVSHDLRRPLTAINSYCQVVQELCGSKLGDECTGYIQEMYNGTLRMNRLIDTLLDFSRLTRVEVRREKVNLSRMAEEVALGLKVSEPERPVTFRIAEGIVADGDAGLLRVALDNLIGNAWKFTGNQEGTIIEFGVTEFDGKPAFFIRDNGPGFDMAQAHKLFSPFQRLPGTDVEGYGIGLATVERIVRRHGGRVWAESEPGMGATIYFTL